MSRITIAIAGLGSRGKDAYAQALAQMPERAKVVAIADPDAAKVREVARQFEIPAERCFDSAEALLAELRLADALVLCTQDRQHVPQAIPALRKGYDILMEKPISPDLAQCKEILAVARETGRKVVVCHVLRYAPFYRKIKEVLDSGVLGELMSIQAIENVGYWHQAHSFVRGNWRSKEETSPMFLQKCCHDMDLMVWLTGKSCVRLSSFGSLGHFRPENAPAGAAKRCLDGCQAKDRCPYDAEKIYITSEKTGVAQGKTGWPCDVLTLHPTEASIRQAIQEGPYGRCVYFCDNDVVDHQVVNLELDDGVTVSFTMCGFTSAHGRTVKVMGTRGDIWGDIEQSLIRVNEFGKPEQVVDVTALAEDLSGHGGGDRRLLADFLNSVRQGKASGLLTGIDASLESHYVALAAEHSRLHGGACVELDAFVRAAQP